MDVRQQNIVTHYSITAGFVLLHCRPSITWTLRVYLAVIPNCTVELENELFS